jgi:hypothetical protein
MIKRGVMRNPPPTPKMPESRPIKPPMENITKTLTLFPANGKYKCHMVDSFFSLVKYLFYARLQFGNAFAI